MHHSSERNHRIKCRLHEIIFEADTPEGKWFDVILLFAILLSVAVVLLDSVSNIHDKYGKSLIIIEWIFTILFTIEYILRIYSVFRPWKYVTSAFGIIDLLSILPTYLSLLFVGTQSLLVIRALRLLRVFRIFKLVSFLDQARHVMIALRKSVPKILVFLSFILVIVTIIGSMMYLIEGGQNERFDSIPRSIYWAIVTLTTVGYGDITPVTNLGQLLSAVVMLMGYAIIAVPTGIVSAEIIQSAKKSNKVSTQACQYCGKEGHAYDAKYCKHCGEPMHAEIG